MIGAAKLKEAIVNEPLQMSERPPYPEFDAQSADEASDVDVRLTPDDTGNSPLSSDDLLEQMTAKAAQNWERYLRTAAELENVRKRATRDVEQARRYALESFSRELLAVKDSLELGLDAADSDDATGHREGSLATLKLLSAAFQQFGIDEINPEGQPFDPELHEALSLQPAADAEPNSVLYVVQKGYTLNGRLLRPARVIVASAPGS